MEKHEKIISLYFWRFNYYRDVFPPECDYINGLFHCDKEEMREEEIIRMVSGRNPRVEEIQNFLKEAGFDPDLADKVMGD